MLFDSVPPHPLLPRWAATPQFVIPPVPACRGSVLRFPTALPAATYAALREESRTKSTEAMVLDRKSGGSRATCSSLSRQATPRVRALKAAELLDGEAHRRSLGCPGFPVKAGGVANSMRFSLQKTAHAALSSAANRKSGYARDDKLKGGGPPWQWWRRMDRTTQQQPTRFRFARVLFNPFRKLRRSEGHSYANLDSSG